MEMTEFRITIPKEMSVYLTTSKLQAEKWAKSVAKRRKGGDPILNIYTFEENAMEGERLKIMFLRKRMLSGLIFLTAMFLK